MRKFAQDMARLKEEIRVLHDRRSAFVAALKDDNRARMERCREEDQARAREHARRAAHVPDILARFQKDRLEMAPIARAQRAAFVARNRRIVEDLRHENAEEMAAGRRAWATGQA